MGEKMRTLGERKPVRITPMKDVASRFLTSDPEVLLREALGLAALCAVIIAGFCLPATF